MFDSDHPGNQALTPQQIVLALSTVAGMLALMVLYGAGYRWTATAIAASAVALFFVKAPREDLARIGAEMDRQDKTRFGRAVRFAKLGIYALVGLALVSRWLLS